MGIDIYASWPGMTEKDHEEQLTGFSVQHGHVGYLREAYHGGPYATQQLLPESFRHEDWAPGQECKMCEGEGYFDRKEDDDRPGPDWTDKYVYCQSCGGSGCTDGHYQGAEIPAAKLVERLPGAIMATLIREAEVYQDPDARSAVIEICGYEPKAPHGRSAKAEGTEELMQKIGETFGDISLINVGAGGLSVEENEAVTKADLRCSLERFHEIIQKFPTAVSLIGFVKLCEEKEKEHGRPCRVYASY